MNANNVIEITIDVFPTIIWLNPWPHCLFFWQLTKFTISFMCANCIFLPEYFLFHFTHLMSHFIVLQYYLNVCRPLLPQYGLSCSAHTAACRAIQNGTKNPEQEQVSDCVDFLRFSVNTEHEFRPLLYVWCGCVCVLHVCFVASMSSSPWSSMHDCTFTIPIISITENELSIFIQFSFKTCLANMFAGPIQFLPLFFFFFFRYHIS